MIIFKVLGKWTWEIADFSYTLMKRTIAELLINITLVRLIFIFKK